VFQPLPRVCPYHHVQLAGKQATVPLNADVTASINEHAPWDGKDAVIDAVEEIDLSELDEL
jgi:hypothetical protein